MGYTHYWNTEKITKQDKEGYKKALPIVQDILKRHAALVQYESDDNRPPVVGAREIRFNGIGENAHETFMFCNKVVQYVFSDGSKVKRAFCKTARKPYDVVVCEVLLVLKRFLPNLTISSDGFSGSLASPEIDGEWGAAVENVRQYGIHYDIVVTNKRDPWCDIEPVLRAE